MKSDLKIAVLGAGSFGTALSNLIAKNYKLNWYCRSEEQINSIRKTRKNRNQIVNDSIEISSDLERIINENEILIPSIPSNNFRAFIKSISKWLKPHHIIIHTIKGFDIDDAELNADSHDFILDRKNVKTISEVIYEESLVKKVGVISGPNLALEIAADSPTATVIASKFESVQDLANKIFRTNRFMVYKNDDIIGVETAGTLKNIYAIGAGIVGGLNLGENAKAFLISRGLSEMTRIGELFTKNKTTFMGIAGIGDLVCTCSSELSRNYRVGKMLTQGKSITEILENLNEVAEGIKTVMIAKALSNKYGTHIPISSRIFEVLFGKISVERGIKEMMSYNNLSDVDFL